MVAPVEDTLILAVFHEARPGPASRKALARDQEVSPEGRVLRERQGGRRLIATGPATLASAAPWQARRDAAGVQGSLVEVGLE